MYKQMKNTSFHDLQSEMAMQKLMEQKQKTRKYMLEHVLENIRTNSKNSYIFIHVLTHIQVL